MLKTDDVAELHRFTEKRIGRFERRKDRIGRFKQSENRVVWFEQLRGAPFSRVHVKRGCF